VYLIVNILTANVLRSHTVQIESYIYFPNLFLSLNRLTVFLLGVLLLREPEPVVYNNGVLLIYSS